ncbi:hypothetical protein [Fodinibius sp.]|uniref:hypothetical protein n=1 Tax=Fodinibius sp. TaxID=1872440 RepID=UPI002ACD69E9|nr:hypothetical protein [Fodinibius sp.]MDZ7658084.1 hypothetical protein [Fodinibius sp.]
MLKPPQNNEVFPECEGLLKASEHASSFGQIVSVSDGFLQLDEPDGHADDGHWRRVVLMPVTNGIADAPEQLDKVRGYRFRVRCDFMPPQLGEDETFDDIGLDLQAFLEGQHQKVYEALHGKELTLTKAEQLYKVKRLIPAGNMHREPDKGYRYMAAEYLTVLGPTN